MDEEWKLLEGFDCQYWISNKGRVWNDKTKRFLTSSPKRDRKALCVSLRKNGKSYSNTIQSYVSKLFVPDPLDTKKEKWKDIVGYEGYYRISTLGRVWSCVSKKFLSPKIDKHGYLYFGLGAVGNHCKEKKMQGHRLVAMAFIPNPDCKPEVNHKDCNPSNNNVDNLEWVTRLENLKWGGHDDKVREAVKKKMIPVVQLSLNNEFIKEWPSAASASKEFNWDPGNIARVCKGKMNTYKEYKWKYKEDYEKEGSNEN